MHPNMSDVVIPIITVKVHGPNSFRNLSFTMKTINDNVFPDRPIIEIVIYETMYNTSCKPIVSCDRKFPITRVIYRCVLIEMNNRNYKWCMDECFYFNDI